MLSEATLLFDPPIVLHLGPVLGQLADDDLYAFCRLNRELRIERTARGELVIMPPAGGNTGRRGSLLAVQLGNWALRDGTGMAFDSSTGFCLPNGAMRSPDAAWILRSRWEALSDSQRERFPPLAPDFVVELASPTDRIADLRAKLREYIDCQVRLGWLIDPTTKQVEIYRPDREPEILTDPATIRAEPELPGFVLDLTDFW
jgi:Uma2 family endonuclease